MKQSKIKRLEKDIAYCIDDLNLGNEEIGEILRCCERLGVAVEQFCEEFVFICIDDEGNEDVEALERVHDDSYLSIAEFNSLYWEGNQ